MREMGRGPEIGEVFDEYLKAIVRRRLRVIERRMRKRVERVEVEVPRVGGACRLGGFEWKRE